MITNPELVKTDLDLLKFPTIIFMQSGWNVYSLQQAARRSGRFGQTQAVRVIFLGYAGTSQMTCMQLMARRSWCPRVRRETCQTVPNQDGDSVEVALARQLGSV
ncbi:hypothetical protein D3C85_722850 [compost metagenome]